MPDNVLPHGDPGSRVRHQDVLRCRCQLIDVTCLDRSAFGSVGEPQVHGQEPPPCTGGSCSTPRLPFAGPPDPSQIRRSSGRCPTIRLMSSGISALTGENPSPIAQVTRLEIEPHPNFTSSVRAHGHLVLGRPTSLRSKDSNSNTDIKIAHLRGFPLPFSGTSSVLPQLFWTLFFASSPPAVCGQAATLSASVPFVGTRSATRYLTP